MAWTLKLLFVATLVAGCSAAGVGAREAITDAPSTTNTTVDPSTTNTTVDPSTTNTTVAPSTTNTTVAPSTTNTTDGSPTTNTTDGSPTTNTTDGSPTTPQTDGSPSTTVPATTELPDPCNSQPCKGGSTCQPRANQSFVCLCLPGDYYDNSTKICSTAKVFPGELSYPDMKYNDSLADQTSLYFLETSEAIVNNMSSVFASRNKGYMDSIVLEFRKIAPKNKGVTASMEIIFSADSDAKEDTVEKAIKNATEGKGPLSGANFTATDLCGEGRNPCDTHSSKCNSENGLFNCSCLSGFIPTDYSDRICVSCPSGLRPNEFGDCQPCNFGYSGFNCQESWKLTLVIVGSVLGGLLLITIILLPIVAKKPSKKSSKKNKMKETGKSNLNQMSLAPAPAVHGGLAESQPISAQGGSSNSLAAFANAGVPRIPRATTTSGRDRGSNLEMTPSNSRQNLIPGGRNMRPYDDGDDMSGHGYTRPQSNPYAQNRAPFNPYGQSQGQSNPYFASDVGRRY